MAKIEVLVIARNIKILNIRLDDTNVYQVDNVKYLVAKFDQEGNMECEINNRVSSAI